MVKNQKLDWTNLEPSDPSELRKEGVKMEFWFTPLAYWRYEKFCNEHDKWAHSKDFPGIECCAGGSGTITFNSWGGIRCKCTICGAEANITDYSDEAF